MSINVANNNPHVVYTVAEGATQTTFSITFEFFDDDEVQLYVDGIIKTQGSGDGNYTITGGEGSTGTATFNTVSSGIQPVTGITGGSQVVITRNIPIERVTDFSAGSDINRAALNTQLDTLTAIAADNKMRSVRALTAPITDPTDVGTSLVIPKAADRANGFLSFDSNGDVSINSVVDLSFLSLERLDIDNVRIDGNTVSSTTGSLILAPTADVEINIPASSSLYMQRAGTTGLAFEFTSISQEIRFINTTTATTYSVIQSNHLGGTSSDLILKSDGGPLELDTGGGTIPLKDDGVQRGYLNINTANTIKLYTGTGTGTLNTTFDGADVTIAGELVVSGNLTVDGTTTTINSTTLTVDDKNIVLASGATTSLAADGAGITIDGASASLTYVHLTGAMTFNKDVDIGDNDIENAQKLHFTENVSLYPSDGDDSILNLQAEDTGSAQLRFITGTGSGVFRGGIVASQNNVFGLKDSNDQTFIKSQDGNLPTQIFHTYDSPSAGSSLRIEAGSNFVKLYGSEGVEAQKYKDADDTSYYLEPAGTSVLATVGATQLNVDNITIDGNTISSTDTDGNINLRCNGSGVVDVDSELFVYGNAINGTSAYVQIGNTDTGGDDVRIQGPNPNFSLYDSTAVADGVAAYTGGVNFYGQKTNTAYHQYSTIRPRIINGLDSDTAKTGALHFGVSDGASAAATNIIFKIEPDGIEVAGNITSTNDPLKISATTASSTANIILEGDTSPILSLRASGSNDDKISFKSDGAFQYINTNDQLTIQTGTGDALFLFGSSDIRTDAISGTHTISSRAGDISFITGTSGSTTERLKVTGAGLVQSLSETQIVNETLKVTNGSTYGSLSMDENTGSSRDYFDIKAFGHDGSSTEGGAVRLFSASSLESIRTYSTGTTGAGYTTFNFPYDLSYGTGVYHLTVASANRSGLYLRSGVSGSDADGKQYGELSASSSEFKMVGWFGANIEFKIGGDLGETKIAEVNSDGIDITGTLTSDALTVDGVTSSFDTTPSTSGLQLHFETDTGLGSIGSYVSGGAGLGFYTNTGTDPLKQRIKISGGGDISFYEDTGTTAKFFWDASAESLGIGTSSPSAALEIVSTTSIAGARLSTSAGSDSEIEFINTSSGNHTWAIGQDFSNSNAFSIAYNNAVGASLSSNAKVVITSSGNVGIGESNPDAKLHIRDATDGGSSSTTSAIQFSRRSGGANDAAIKMQHDGSDGVSNLQFHFGTSEAMRIDSSGNLLVGGITTLPSSSVNGFGVLPTGIIVSSVANDKVTVFNRNGLDGEISLFQKDGTTVGSIGSYSGGVVSYILLDTRSSAKGAGLLGSSIDANTGILQPVDKVGALADDAIELGTSSTRFKNLYLSGGIEIENGTGNVGVGKDALRVNTAVNNTAVGAQAGYNSNSTNGRNTFIGTAAGYAMTTGEKNTIIGRYSGNFGGLDIRTSSNNIVLSDGDGNPRLHIDSAGTNYVWSTSAPMIWGRNETSGAVTGLAYYNTAANIGSFTGQVFRVMCDGDVENTNNSYGAISDIKLKENIVDASSQWDDLKALQVRNYNFKAETGYSTHTQLGLVAQEVELVSPNLVGQSVDDETNEITKTVNYSVLYMKAVKALQEAMDRIETLEAKVTALENA